MDKKTIKTKGKNAGNARFYHDIRNHLTIVKINLDLLVMQLEKTKGSKEIGLVKKLNKEISEIVKIISLSEKNKSHE